MPEHDADRMICFDLGSHRFQLRAAAIVVEDGHVLLHRVVDETIWALPGGRVEAGESAAVTIAREMQEEVGEIVVCRELLFTVENFFQYGERQQHELGLYHRAELDPSSKIRDKTCSHEGIEADKQLEFRWFAIDILQQVKLYPAFLRTELAAPLTALRHIVQNG